jgi:hypothetical protein
VVAAGGVRFRRNAIGEDPYISRERAQWQDPAVFPQTVQRLVADGLLHQDITENVYRPGQLLSLTAQGEADLRHRTSNRHDRQPGEPMRSEH